jgi:cysteine desulfurase/selenocysteine lyase
VTEAGESLANVGADFEALRGQFPLLAADPGLHYLDSAATSQKPQCVIDAIADCYRGRYASVHRGLYPLAEAASLDYERARQRLADYINAPSADEVVFTRSATEAINLVATGWAGTRLEPGDRVWVSRMEHHSNYLPWQRVCRESGAELRIIPLDAAGELDLAAADGLFDARTRLIAVTQVSNVLGVVNPVADICARAARHSIPVLVDAAQSVGHMPVDVQSLGCDFLAASAHKMCGPGGIGLLYGRGERLAETEPALLGGGMVDQVRDDDSQWADIPARFEAGSPNLAGAVGFAAAADYLDAIGRQAIADRERELAGSAFDLLSAIDGIEFYPASRAAGRSGILSFNLEGVHPHDIAQIAGEHGVAIRAGHHCCQPLMRQLGVSSTARASFAFYNNDEDVAALAAALREAGSLLRG